MSPKRSSTATATAARRRQHSVPPSSSSSSLNEWEDDSPTKFKMGEEVWCEWRKYYYKAKILKVELKTNSEQYYSIHYIKFQKKWDSAVSEGKLLSMNKENNKFVKMKNKEFYAARKKKIQNEKIIAEIYERNKLPIWKRPPFVVLYKLSNEEVAARRLLFQTSKCATTSEKKIPDDKSTNPHNISVTKEEYTDCRVSSINDSHLKQNVQSSSATSSKLASNVDKHNKSKNSLVKRGTKLVKENNSNTIVINKDSIKDQEHKNLSSLKDFSSEEKYVISALDTMYTRTSKCQSSSVPRDCKGDGHSVKKTDANFSIATVSVNKSEHEDIISNDTSLLNEINSPGPSTSSILSNKKIHDKVSEKDNIKKNKYNKRSSKHIDLFLDKEDDIILSYYKQDISISDNSKCNSTKPLVCNSSVKTIADQDVLVNNALIIDNDISVSDNCKFNTKEIPECNNLIKTTADQGVLVDNTLIIGDDISVSDKCELNTIEVSECNNLIKTTTDQDVLVDSALIIDNDILVSDNCKLNTTEASESNNLINTITDEDVLVDNALIVDDGNPNVDPLNVSSSVKELTEQPLYIAPNDYEENEQVTLNEVEEVVTTSNKEDELQLNVPQCLVNSNDNLVDNQTNCLVYNDLNTTDSYQWEYENEITVESYVEDNIPVIINNFEEEVVTTSKSEDQFVLDDQQGVLYSMDKLLFVDINHVDEEVTTSKLDEELELDDQENIISSNDCSSVGYEVYSTSNFMENNIPETTSIIITTDESHTKKMLNEENRNFDEEVTTSKPEEDIDLDDQENKSCCELNRILTYYRSGPLRISSVSIIAERSDLENNMDDHKRSIIRETNSSGSTSLIVTTALTNNEKQIDDGEKNNIKCKDKHKSNVSIKLKNNTEPFVYSEDDLISNKSDCGSNDTSKLDKNDPSISVSSFVSTTNNTDFLDDIEENNDATLSLSTIETNNKRKMNDICDKTIDEDKLNVKKIKSSSTAKFDNIDNISFLEGEATDEDDHESKASSISITMSNNEKEINDHYTKTTNDLMFNNNPTVNECNSSEVENSSPVSITITSNKKTINDYNEEETTDVSKASVHEYNNNELCRSASSSTSIPLSNHQIESDNENDGQTTDDDDNYIKNKKVTKKKLKTYDEDHNIFLLFGCEKPYSRAAKVKANEAISQMRKPLVNKDKKSETGKRTKSSKKKDDDNPFDEPLKLSDYNLELPLYIYRILIEDKHLVEDDRFIPRVPAKLSVYTILRDYASKFPVCEETLDVLFEAFNHSLSVWLLHPLEKPNYCDMLQKYPDRPMYKIYGFPHLLRFIIKLPKIFHMLRNFSSNFIPQAVHFVRGLFIYLVDENVEYSIDSYDPVMPDKYRRAYYS